VSCRLSWSWCGWICVYPGSSWLGFVFPGWGQTWFCVVVAQVVSQVAAQVVSLCIPTRRECGIWLSQPAWMVMSTGFVFPAHHRGDNSGYSKWLHVVRGRPMSPPICARSVTGEGGENGQSSSAVSERREAGPHQTVGCLRGDWYSLPDRAIAIDWVTGRSGHMAVSPLVLCLRPPRPARCTVRPQ